MIESLVWTGADGVARDLCDGSSEVQEGLAGIDVPPAEVLTMARLSAAGSSLIGRRWAERHITVPMRFVSADADDLLGEFAAAFSGPGTLECGNGTRTRELRDVIYRGGMEGIRAREYGIHGTWRKTPVELTALDPWWYGDGDIAVLITLSLVTFDDAVAFDDESTLFDGSAPSPIAVSGHAAASPVTTIVGPYDTLSVGLAGGQSFELASALAAGDVITVDARPGSRGPRLNSGPVDWSLLTPTSRLFELPVGSSVLLAQGTGDDADSLISVAWDERWLTP